MGQEQKGRTIVRADPQHEVSRNTTGSPPWSIDKDTGHTLQSVGKRRYKKKTETAVMFEL
jgi:hypothetical protein